MKFLKSIRCRYLGHDWGPFFGQDGRKVPGVVQCRRCHATAPEGSLP